MALAEGASSKEKLHESDHPYFFSPPGLKPRLLQALPKVALFSPTTDKPLTSKGFQSFSVWEKIAILDFF